jgi:divalent metal cation (Fe/Co/Zn/Cd) transporter
VLETHPGVLSYHKLRTRKAGPQRHADVHVQIDDNCTLVEAHTLTEQLEDRIRATLSGININIHIEPYLDELRHQQEVHGVHPPISNQISRQISEQAASEAAASEHGARGERH